MIADADGYGDKDGYGDDVVGIGDTDDEGSMAMINIMTSYN